MKDLKEMLAKNGLGSIPQLSPSVGLIITNYYMCANSFFAFKETYPLKDNDEELLQCVQEIKRRLGNMGGILFDSNEAMRCEYISAILHNSLYIVKRAQKDFTLE